MKFIKQTMLFFIVLLSNNVFFLDGMDLAVTRTASADDRGSERAKFIRGIEQVLDKADTVSLNAVEPSMFNRLIGGRTSFYLQGPGVEPFCNVFMFIRGTVGAAMRSYDYCLLNIKLMIRMGHIPLSSEFKHKDVADLTICDIYQILGNWGRSGETTSRMSNVVDKLRQSSVVKDVVAPKIGLIDLIKGELVFKEKPDNIKAFFLQLTEDSLKFYVSTKQLLLLVNGYLDAMRKSYEEATKTEIESNFRMLIGVAA